jgi:DNA repair protein RadA
VKFVILRKGPLRVHEKKLKAIILLEKSTNNYDLNPNDRVQPQNNVENKKTAAEYFNIRQKSIERISTGSEKLDKLLAGGIETKAVTQFYGESDSGKTQICHILCATVSQNKIHGGLDARSIYIDTEGNFRPERIIEIATARGFDVDLTLENIIPYSPIDVKEQERIIEKEIYHDLNENDKSRRVKLIVVDSPVALYRSEYVGRKMLSERQQKLYKFMMSLKQLAQKYNLAVVVTNQATTVPDSKIDPDESCKPYGGNVMGHATTYGIHLSHILTDPGIFRAQLVKSSYHPYGEVAFMINRQGILD